MSVHLRREDDPVQPTSIDILIGHLELMGQIAYRSGIKSQFALWRPQSLIRTDGLKETFMKGTSSINEAIQTFAGFDPEGLSFRNRVLKEVIPEEDAQFLEVAPNKYHQLIKERYAQLAEQGDNFPLFKYSVGVVKGLVGILVATEIPYVQYHFEAQETPSGEISVTEELVSGLWPNDIGPHSYQGANRFS